MQRGEVFKFRSDWHPSCSYKSKSEHADSINEDKISLDEQVRTLSESDIKSEEGKGEYQFFIGERDKLKARLDLKESERENGDQELNRFFLGGENKRKAHSDHK